MEENLAFPTLDVPCRLATTPGVDGADVSCWPVVGRDVGSLVDGSGVVFGVGGSVGSGVCRGVGTGVGFAVGPGVGRRVGAGVGNGVGCLVGLSVGGGVGVGVGDGEGGAPGPFDDEEAKV